MNFVCSKILIQPFYFGDVLQNVSVDDELSVMPQLHHASYKTAFVPGEGQKNRSQTEEREDWDGVLVRGQREAERSGEAVIIIVDELAFPVATELSVALCKVQDC